MGFKKQLASKQKPTLKNKTEVFRDSAKAKVYIYF